MPGDDGFVVVPDELLEGAERTLRGAALLGDGHGACVAALGQAAAGGGDVLAGALGELTAALDAAATDLGTVLTRSVGNLQATAAAYRLIDAAGAGALAALTPVDEP